MPTAPLSKYKKNNIKIFILIAVLFAVWFAYDGYVNESFREKHTEDGVPNSTLVFNQKAPYYLVGVSVLLAGYLFVIKDDKIVADDEKITINGKKQIPYNAITSLDKTFFESKGVFTVNYKSDSGSEVQQKFSDRTYDGLPAVLEQIIAKIS
jgi:hypothetical protein